MGSLFFRIRVKFNTLWLRILVAHRRMQIGMHRK